MRDSVSPELLHSLGRLAVLIPCYNEALTIDGVVRGFRAELPSAEIYVYDNNSKDETAEVARRAGAVVRREPFQGKGNVVRRMFADVEADTYVLIDGDGTYDIASVSALLESYARSHADMVNGSRVTEIEEAYRPGHWFGNRMLTALVGSIFGHRFKDILSGYRVLSRRFVKSFPAMSHGFEIETELTVHALELRMVTEEVETPYYPRPEGSESKLRTFRDGWKILWTIAYLVKEERPFRLFSILSVILSVTSVILAIPIVITYMETGLVPRFPTAILATGLMLLAFLGLTSGLILEAVTRSRKETKLLHYLAIPAPSGSPGERRPDNEPAAAERRAAVLTADTHET